MVTVVVMTITITRTGIERQTVSRILYTYLVRYVALQRYIDHFLLRLYCAGSIFLCSQLYGVLFGNDTVVIIVQSMAYTYIVKFRTNKKERNELKPKNQNKKPTPKISFDETEKFAYLITCARCVGPGMGVIIMAPSQHGSQMAMLLLLWILLLLF